jgi:polysaccharide export outer membrane protein
VEIINYRPFYIVGEVKSPGSYPYVSGMTAINAVALAGGFTYRAKEDEFRIDRGVEGKVKKMEAGPSTEVLPGDVIIIPERFF